MSNTIDIDKQGNEKLWQILSDVDNKLSLVQNNEQNENYYFLQCVFILLKELEQYCLATEEAVGAFHIRNGQLYEAVGFIDDGTWPVENGMFEVFITPKSAIYNFKE
ncbi:hypothetical protein CWD08_25645 [Salmonella enterica]|nr:hypothetical protein [Salmonella enterica]